MTDIKVFEGITSVAFSQKLTSSSTYCEILDRIGKAGINLDMISADLAVNDSFCIGFTVDDRELPRLLPLIKDKDISTPVINCGNVKFVIRSESMINTPGFAARVFSELKKVGCVPVLITTGVDEISILVSDSDSADVGKALAKMFE